MKPIGKYIIIKTIEEEIKTSSGLLLSSEDANQLRYKKGLVIKSGSDVDVIHEKDLIYYDKRAGIYLAYKRRAFYYNPGEGCRCCRITLFMSFIIFLYTLSVYFTFFANILFPTTEVTGISSPFNFL